MSIPISVSLMPMRTRARVTHGVHVVAHERITEISPQLGADDVVRELAELGVAGPFPGHAVPIAIAIAIS